MSRFAFSEKAITKMQAIVLSAIVIAAVVAVGGWWYISSRPSAPPERAYWPTTGWRTSTPEEQGMDSELLAEALDFLLEHREEYQVDSMLIIRHGYVVACMHA